MTSSQIFTSCTLKCVPCSISDSEKRGRIFSPLRDVFEALALYVSTFGSMEEYPFENVFGAACKKKFLDQMQLEICVVTEE